MDLISGIGALLLEFVLGFIESFLAPIFEGIFGGGEDDSLI